jgi:WhiB family redox-sensing transcriptional regulator
MSRASQPMLPVTTGARSLSWMLGGACRQADPELFFPIAAVTGPAARQVEAAKAVCGRCDVRPNCLSYALEAMPEGIWGGTTPEERREARGTSLRRARHAASQQVPPVVLHDELAGQPAVHLTSRWSGPPAAAGAPPRGDQVEDQQEDGRAGDGGQPGGEVEEPVQGVDVEQLRGEPTDSLVSKECDVRGSRSCATDRGGRN